MAETISALPEQLYVALQKESFGLSTIDFESGGPCKNASSCLLPRSCMSHYLMR
jgi:hypothetical protein